MRLILGAVFKNEAHVLSEWIQHYLQRDVDHIYLINDHSTDAYEPIIEHFKQTTGRITLMQNDIETRKPGRQTLIYERFLRPFLPTADWIMVLDLDEFLYSPIGKSIKSTLADLPAWVAQVKIDWLHFGSNGHRLQPLSVVSGFTMRAAAASGNEWNSHKSITRTAALQRFEIHLNVVQGLTHHFPYKDDTPPPLVINHYNLQSYEFYINVKGRRGDADNHFDTIGRLRDDALFRNLDHNEVEDLRLWRQNESIDPMIGRTLQEGVTLLITSCYRPHLLARTLASFVAMNTYPITRTIILDDSGRVGCNESVVEPYRDTLKITTLYHPTNRGQIISIDELYSYVRTEWIFHCEEDWQFLQPQFIEKSMRVFAEHPTESIYTVWLRPHHSTSDHPIQITEEGRSRGYYEMSRAYTYEYQGNTYVWCGVTFNPGLRRTRDAWRFHPYHLMCPAVQEPTVGEYSVNDRYRQAGYYSMILADPAGHVDHIGWGEHVPRP